MYLDEKTVVITGGASGIGRATAVRAAEAGAEHVVVADLDVEGCEETAGLVRDEGAGAEARQLDVRDYDAFEALLRSVKDEQGSVDVLHNNAGIQGPIGPLEETTLEERDRVIDVNVNGVWNGCRAVVPLMREQGSGAIVNTSSVSGFVASPGVATYCLSKAAVLNFTRAVAHEVGADGIRVNAVCPGMTETNMISEFYSGFDDPEAARAEFEEEFSLKRLGQPEEIASCVVFLASDEASFVTGHGLTVDGGFTIH